MVVHVPLAPKGLTPPSPLPRVLRARLEGMLEPDREHVPNAAKESTLTPPEPSLRRSARCATSESTTTVLAWAQPAPTARKESSPPPLATSCARTASPEPTLHKKAQKNVPSAKRANTHRSQDQRPATTVPLAHSPTTGAPLSAHFAPGASTAVKEHRSARSARTEPTPTQAVPAVLTVTTRPVTSALLKILALTSASTVAQAFMPTKPLTRARSARSILTVLVDSMRALSALLAPTMSKDRQAARLALPVPSHQEILANFAPRESMPTSETQPALPVWGKESTLTWRARQSARSPRLE